MMKVIVSKLAMMTLKPVLLASLIALAPAVSAHAGACDSKGRAIASQQGGKLLSAQASGNKCRIKILVPQPKGPPKSRVVVVSK